jgi:hypothetical protein
MSDIYENAVDMMLDFSATRVADRIFDEIDNSIADEDIIFSKQHINIINEIILSEKNDISRRKRKRLQRHILLTAIIALTLLLLSALTVSAFREKIISVFTEITSKGTVFHYEADDTDNTEKFNLAVNYIPADFEITQQYSNENEYYIRYSNNNLFFDVDKQLPPDAYTLNTENGNIEYIDINGSDALFSASDNLKIITWIKNDYVYTISGNIDKDELIGIAKNIY